jgi:hypothetical protein
VGDPLGTPLGDLLSTPSGALEVIAGNEIADMLGDGDAFDIAAGLNFEGDIRRDVVRPVLKRVESGTARCVVYNARNSGASI